MAVVYLNHRYVRAERARVSIADRGMLYGDSLFETLRVYRGRVMALAEHLARLESSAAALRIVVPAMDWASVAAELLRRNDLDRADAWLRIAVTRGPSARGLLPPADPKPTTIVTCGALDPATAQHQRRGVSAVTLEFQRGALLAGHKTANYLDAVMGKMIAADAGAYEGIFTGARGEVFEATTANLFCIVDDRLVTPRLGAILPGVTRALVLELARRQGWDVAERRVVRRDLARAAEVFLTSSIAEVVPVIAIDGVPVGDGKPGERTRQVQALYRAYVRACLRR